MVADTSEPRGGGQWREEEEVVALGKNLGEPMLTLIVVGLASSSLSMSISEVGRCLRGGSGKSC